MGKRRKMNVLLWNSKKYFVFIPIIESYSWSLHCMLKSIDQLRWIQKLLVIIIWMLDYLLEFFSIGRRERERERRDNCNKKKRFVLLLLLLLVQTDTSDWLTIVLCLYMQLLKMKWREEKMFSLSSFLFVCLYFERKRKHVVFSSADPYMVNIK